jgi:hypothetical protein
MRDSVVHRLLGRVPLTVLERAEIRVYETRRVPAFMRHRACTLLFLRPSSSRGLLEL